jgi:P27 family predicted phage terminase small subunit
MRARAKKQKEFAMGRPTKPTALKLISGTAQKCRMNKNEPTPETEAPEIPGHLSGEAKAEWERIVPELLSMGLLSKMDRAALAGYCVSWGRHVKAEAEIAANGMTIETPTGGRKTSPFIAISRQEREMMKKFLLEFGLTPASRSKVSATPKEKTADPKQRFFK